MRLVLCWLVIRLWFSGSLCPQGIYGEGQLHFTFPHLPTAVGAAGGAACLTRTLSCALCCAAAGSSQTRSRAPPLPLPHVQNLPWEGLTDHFCSPFTLQAPCPAL